MTSKNLDNEFDSDLHIEKAEDYDTLQHAISKKLHIEKSVMKLIYYFEQIEDA